MDDLEQMYQEVILEESRSPFGKVSSPTGEHQSHQFNPTCGDEVMLVAGIAGSGEAAVLEQIQWDGNGCSISMASTSIMAKLVTGQTISEFLTLYSSFKELMNSRGLGIADSQMDALGDASVFVGTSKFPARIKCALLGWVALNDVVTHYLASGEVILGQATVPNHGSNHIE